MIIAITSDEFSNGYVLMFSIKQRSVKTIARWLMFYIRRRTGAHNVCCESFPRRIWPVQAWTGCWRKLIPPAWQNVRKAVAVPDQFARRNFRISENIELVEELIHSRGVREGLFLFPFPPIPIKPFPFPFPPIPMIKAYSHSHFFPIPLFPIPIPITVMTFLEISKAKKSDKTGSNL